MKIKVKKRFLTQKLRIKRYYSLKLTQLFDNKTLINNEYYIFNLYHLLFVYNSLIFSL